MPWIASRRSASTWYSAIPVQRVLDHEAPHLGEPAPPKFTASPQGVRTLA
jgi:hypothetical protein